MIEKQSILCIAADVESSAELISLARQVGPHIAIFKTHVDAIPDFSAATAGNLVKLAETHNFMIMEDRY